MFQFELNALGCKYSLAITNRLTKVSVALPDWCRLQVQRATSSAVAFFTCREQSFITLSLSFCTISPVCLSLTDSHAPVLV